MSSTPGPSLVPEFAYQIGVLTFGGFAVSGLCVREEIFLQGPSNHTRTRDKLSSRRYCVVSKAHSEGLSRGNGKARSRLRGCNAQRGSGSQNSLGEHGA
jgi:hypothetical protein